MYKRQAKQVSYSKTKRPLWSVKYIVIHYTGNINDSAKNNADYFATGNTKESGAHFFVDQKGEIAQSISMHYTAWAVGKDYRSGRVGEAKYYKKCTNANSVSIELCDCATKDPSKEQIAAVKRLIDKLIKKKCPNANTIIRHYDCNGKVCPARMIDEKKWADFLKAIS